MNPKSPEQSHGRLQGVDALRCFMIFLVVALHAAMTYMLYVPEWWYVIDARRTLFFTGLVIVLDTFPMPALFLLAGYFAPSSLRKAGLAPFLKNKLFRLGLPWLLGMLLVVPFLARATMTKYGLPEKPILGFLRNDFFDVWYQQGHFWFLGVLFLIMALFALCAPRVLPAMRRHARPGPGLMLWTGLLCLSALAYVLSARFVKPVDEWLNLFYVIYFQPARITAYVLAFLFGVYAHASGWFAAGGWRPDIAPWGLLAFFSALARVAWKLTDNAGMPTAFADILEAATYILPAFAVTFFLLALFLRHGPALDARFRFFAPHSFGIYWWHQCVLLPVMHFLLPLAISPYAKFAVSCLITLVVCRCLAVLTQRAVRAAMPHSGPHTPSRSSPGQ